MDKKLFKEFVKVQAKFEEIEKMRDMLRTQIVTSMDKEGVEKEETTLGTFTVAVRQNWEYTEAVDLLKDKVKLAQVKEQKKGLAKATETRYLRYTAPTIDEA
jgi:Zn-dependent M32 family carboxypeptidase